MFRPNGGDSRLTLRRLSALLRSLPYEAPLWMELREAHEKAEADAQIEHLRSREDYYKRTSMEAEAS